MTREVFSWLMVGFNGTGKTTLQKLIATRYKKRFPNRKIIRIFSAYKENPDGFPCDVFLGNDKIFKNRKLNPNLWDYLLQCKNCLIVFDDIRSCISNDMNELLVLNGNRRQNSLDLMFCFHTIRATPPKILEYATKFTFFQIQDNSKKMFEKLPFWLGDDAARIRLIETANNLQKFECFTLSM